jgi:hypothetical protein
MRFGRTDILAARSSDHEGLRGAEPLENSAGGFLTTKAHEDTRRRGGKEFVSGLFSSFPLRVTSCAFVVKSSACVFAVSLLLVGCAVQPQSPAQLEDRLKNALLIGDASAHEEKLRELAIDSANFNYEPIAAKAITDMADSTLRDETAEEAAHIFDDRGDRPSAEALVLLINDGARRDKMREQFSTEPFKVPVDQNGNPIALQSPAQPATRP